MTTWRIEQIVTLVGCRTPELEAWIAEQWIRPARDDSGWVFADADLARARLIRDLVEELAIEADTVPVVLSLIDQNHALRRQLHDILATIGALPTDTRDEIARRLGLGQIS
ncbi:MAG: chaperone modulator CbpM [Reyranellaceae bacterium]